jgi:hypothetical protein
MSIKEVSSGTNGDGLQVIWGVWKAGKLKETLWYKDFPSKKECRAAAKLKEIEFDKQLRARLSPQNSSLRDIDFKSVALKRIENYGDASMRDYFDRLIEMVGSKKPDEWRSSYQNTIKYLQLTPNKKTKKNRSETTINRYKAVFRMVFNFAIEEKIITESDLSLKIKLTSEDGRDRVWTTAERDKIFEVLHNRNSWLRMPVYFSAFNPVRVGDLFGFKDQDPAKCSPGLRRENWKPLKNWVEFYANKTKKENNRPTYLKQIDHELRNHFDSLPGDCPFLFPRIFPDNSWKQAVVSRGYREYDAEWDTVLELAGVKDFHWHDLKHCAITFLLDNGYSELDLKNCGIQYTKRMIDRYYNFDADKAPVLEGFEKPETLLKVSNL